MARDVIELLNFVGWKDDRSIHVVGLSLGGMIAQGTCKVSSLRIDLVET